MQQPAPRPRCPLCGGANACAPAASGSFDTPCWCRGATFSAELLARLSPTERGVACICAACAAYTGTRRAEVAAEMPAEVAVGVPVGVAVEVPAPPGP